MAIAMRYPNKAIVRDKQANVLRAVKRLTELNVEIIRIDLLAKRPVLFVSYCPGVHYFKAERMGQGNDSNGAFLRLVARYSGCDVEWLQADNTGRAL